MSGTSDRSLPVLIAGGGIGGLAAALALSKIGRPSIVFEQAAAKSARGSRSKMFEVLGIREAIERVAVFPDSLLIRDAITGEEAMHIPLGPEFIARYRYPYGVICGDRFFVMPAKADIQEFATLDCLDNRLSSE